MIPHGSTPEARHVVRNNAAFLNPLTECIEIANSSTELLDQSCGPSNPAEPGIGAR